MKPVAVSQRVDTIPDRQEVRDALDHRLIDFLQTAGYLPVPVPNCLCRDSGATGVPPLQAWLQAVQPAAIVLSGGNDLGQYVERDHTESLLLTHARDLGLPVLGLCRGMQMLAHWSGARLKKVQGHVRTQHHLSGVITGGVNSYHAWVLEDCPRGFLPLARSEDGEIEAMAHNALPWEGWMWHPEREAVFAQRDLQRLRKLFGG